jgi:uridylate kinase
MDSAIIPIRGQTSPALRWKRVVLKISGELLASTSQDLVIDPQTVDRLASELTAAHHELGAEIAVVVGGGNIWRGAMGDSAGMDRATSDQMGMLATVMNALALQEALERHGQPTRVQSAITMADVAEPYVRRRAVRHLEKGRIVIFAAGMGQPYFTTDTPAAVRAAEIEAQAVLKGTHSGVDGVYTADPRVDPSATRFHEVSYDQVIRDRLEVMDLTSITFCKDNSLPVFVFDLALPGNLRRALIGEAVGTLVR